VFLYKDQKYSSFWKVNLTAKNIIVLLFYVQYLIQTNWWYIYSGLPGRPFISSELYD
jgi:hypothetical protein